MRDKIKDDLGIGRAQEIRRVDQVVDRMRRASLSSKRVKYHSASGGHRGRDSNTADHDVASNKPATAWPAPPATHLSALWQTELLGRDCGVGSILRRFDQSCKRLRTRGIAFGLPWRPIELPGFFEML